MKLSARAQLRREGDSAQRFFGEHGEQERAVERTNLIWICAESFR